MFIIEKRDNGIAVWDTDLKVERCRKMPVNLEFNCVLIHDIGKPFYDRRGNCCQSIFYRRSLYQKESNAFRISRRDELSWVAMIALPGGHRGCTQGGNPLAARTPFALRCECLLATRILSKSLEITEGNGCYCKRIWHVRSAWGTSGLGHVSVSSLRNQAADLR